MTNAFSLPPPPEGVTFVEDAAQEPASTLPPPPPGVTFVDDFQPPSQAQAAPTLPPPPPGVTWADEAPAPVAGGSIMRGFHGMVQGGEAFAYALGMTDPDTFAGNVVRENANIAAYPKPESQRALEEALRTDGASALLTNAGGIPSMLGEMVSSSVASIPAAVGGAVAGAPAGPLGAIIGGSLGIGAVAAMDDFGRSFNQYLQGSGVDLNDVTAVRLALNDANLVNEAIQFAAKRAGVSGALNAAGAAIGGKFVQRFFTPETSLFSKQGAKVAGGLTGISAATEGGTTAGQQVVTGEPLDPDAIFVDAFLGGLANVVPMAVPGLVARSKVKSEAPPPEQGRALAPADAEGASGEPSMVSPDPTMPFERTNPVDLEGIKTRIMDEGPERASPQEWNNFLAKREVLEDGTESTPPNEVLPAKAFESDEPISKSDVVRMVEERQLVVEEGEVEVLPRQPGESEIEPQSYKQTLTLAKESFTTAIPDPSSPIIENTRGSLEPVAQVDITAQRDTQGRRVLTVDEVKTPEGGAPIQSALDEVVVQRIMRWAASEGYDFVSWPQRSEGVVAASGGPAVLPVRRIDGEIPSPDIEVETRGVERIADEAGARRVSVRVGSKASPKVSLKAVSTREFAENSARLNKRIEEKPTTPGVHQDVSSIAYANVVQDVKLAPLRQAAELAIKVLRELEKKFALRLPVEVHLTKGMSTAFGDFMLAGNHYLIRINLDNHPTAESVYTTLMHEFGHALALDKWGSVDHSLQQSILEAWTRTMLDPADLALSPTPVGSGRSVTGQIQIRPGGPKGTMGETQLRRRNFVKAMQLNLPESNQAPLWAYTNSGNINSIAYEISFAEFFAEQVAKWSITAEKPMTLVDRFFSSLYQRINSMFQAFRAKFPTEPRAEAEPEIQAWLDEFVKDISPQFAPGWAAQAARSLRANFVALRRAGNPTGAAVPQTPATVHVRTMMQTLFGHTGVPAQVQSLLAESDRMNRTMLWSHSLPQVAKSNIHIAGVQRFTEERANLDHFRNTLQKPYSDHVKIWRGVGRKTSAALNATIRDYMEMTYRTPQEVNKKISRLPTQVEMDAIFAKNNLDDKGKALFGMIRQDFLDTLGHVEALRVEQAQRTIQDPLKAAERILEVQKSFQKMREAPYFPAMRFGDFTLTIRDGNNNIVHFETFESRKMRDAAAKMADSVYPPGVFEKTISMLPKDVKPMMGMAPQLLQAMSEKLNLSKNQAAALQQLQFDLAPSASFRHRFQMKNRISGYSEDFMRSYASYGFHGSSFIARTKYVDILDSYIKAVRMEAEFMPDGTKRSMIASYLSENMEETVLNVHNEWSALRSATFHWMLGFNPASAALNLTQTPLLTMPYLSNKFGDVKAGAALTKTTLSMSTYYKAATLENMADWEYRLMSKANDEAVIQEAMAPTLAGVSEERNLIPFMTRSQGERAWFRFSQASSWMFSNAEKMNRRLAFRAGIKLGWDDPANAHMNSLIKENGLTYQKMLSEGFSSREAGAYIAGKDAVEQTQFVYASWARPKLLRGRKGAILMFQSFTLNTLFTLWNNPGTALRSMVIMLGLGGAMGLPGAEDITDLAKVLAWQIFGKDFNLEREMREFIIAQSEVDPNLILHGGSRYGFGIPQLMDMLGSKVGLGDLPVPTVDMSRAIGLGQLSPVRFADFLGPVSDPDKAISETLQRASGAGLSVGFNIYRAITDSQLPAGDPKRWMRAMPRALANASRAWDTYSTGIDRSQRGMPIQTYDPQDGEQLAEIAAMALGFQPLATTQKWGPIAAMAEVKQFWMHKREIILMQLGYTYTIGDPEQRQVAMAAVRQFNEQLPKELRGYALTMESIRSSLQNRVRNFEMMSRDLPVSRKDVPLLMELSEQFPMAEVGRRTVR